MAGAQPGHPRSLPQGREHVVCMEDEIPPGEHNRRYLRAKKDKLGHLLPDDDHPTAVVPGGG